MGRTAVIETAHDFLDGERGRRRVADIAIRSVNEGTFERIMESAVVNHLREVSRRTDMGKLVLRVTEVLTEEGGFQRLTGRPSRWTVTDAGLRKRSPGYPARGRGRGHPGHNPGVEQ